MEIGTVIVGAVAFLVGLIVGRVWGRASAHHEGNMLTPRRAAFDPPDAIIEEPDESLEEEVRRLVAAGNLINAIKLYRTRKGCGLQEAKDAVERIRG